MHLNNCFIFKLIYNRRVYYLFLFFTRVGRSARTEGRERLTEGWGNAQTFNVTSNFIANNFFLFFIKYLMNKRQTMFFHFLE